MRQRLTYWIFQRGKNCKHCCLWCEYYDLCSGQIEQERQTYKTRLPDGREIAIKSVPEKERQIQRRIIKKYMQKARREHEKL